jgi:tRNA pseudouridine55 synthase
VIRADAPEGLLLVDKPAGPTSHDVVVWVRRALRSTRVGHAGTLDPFATGLLLLLMGRATRLAEYVSALDKTYVATLRLGAASTTGDPEGEIRALVPAPEPPSEDVLRATLGAFLGEQDQVPPIYSAKRVAGERAYRMARRSAPVALAPTRVRIERIELLVYAYPLLRLRVTTGPGTYVRSLARDLGEALASAAYLTALRREEIGPFSVDQAVEPAGPAGEELVGRLQPVEAAVTHLPALAVDGPAALALSRGKRVQAWGARGPAAREETVRLLCPGGFLGIGALGPEGLRGVKILYPERAAT